jgi:hypothetical protein
MEHRPAAAWQIRLLAGASGAVCSAAAGLLLTPTVMGLIFGLVGTPVAAFLGVVYGPELLGEEANESLLRTTAALATVIGTAGVGIGFAITQSRGASIGEVSELAFVVTSLLGVVSGLLGYPLARIVSRLGYRLGRRLLPLAGRVWLPSAVVLALVAVGTVFAATVAVRPAGFVAAVFGQRVPFTYVIRNLSGSDGYLLEARSYADGDVAALDEFPAHSTCTAGEATMLNGSWALWLTDDPESAWADEPRGDPLVTSSQVGDQGRVDLTIVIGSDGAATWHRGTDTADSC